MVFTNFLTSENFDIYGIPIYTSTFIVIVFLILIVIFMRTKKIGFKAKNIFSALFLSASMLTLIIILIYSLTGIFIFSEGDKNLKFYMLVAAVAVFLHIKDSMKELFKKDLDR